MATTKVTRSVITSDAISGSEIADDAIDSEHYVDGSIDTAHLAGDAVTGAKIADDAIDSEHYAAGSIDTAHIADDQITLAKMASGTDGQIITFDASGNPTAVGPGSDGQVLTSTGAGSPPAFEAAAAGGKLLQVVQTVVTAATFSTTSASFVDATGLTVTTGSLATTGSKLLITVHATLGGSNSSSDPAGRLHVSAGTANPILGDAASDRTRGTSVIYSSTNDHNNVLSFSYLTAALGVTSAVTCKLEVRINNGATMYMNKQSSDADNSNSTRLTSSITAMEIGA